ncbi:MAG: HEPN domain-containing protein [Spirochaetales bacterium]|nr:MAG: HEPN domain-containing protein [Spirochaetales bacterium]
METTPEHTRGFRLSKSREKLELASIMLRKGQFGEVVRYSYLSMFYAVRMLLLEEGTDSDDPAKIIELAERYFEPAGWSALDIGALLAMPEGPAGKGVEITREKAEMFYGKASEVLTRIEKPGPVARG